MKYIRTKDGIFDLSRFEFEKGDIDQSKDGSRQDCYWEQHDIEYCHHRCIWAKNIIAQADTIEELCDEFVWVTPEGEHHIKPKTGDGLWYLCCDYKKGHQIYGAIWIQKGLIYIAELTDEGWELV